MSRRPGGRLALILILLLLLLLPNLNIYRTDWSQSARTLTTSGDATEPWSAIWIVPQDTGHPAATQALTDALVQRLRAAGLRAQEAPTAAQLSQEDDLPVLLFLSVAEWEIGWLPLVRPAQASAVLTSQMLGEGCLERSPETLWIAQGVTASGSYQGLVNRRTVNADMAQRLAESLCEKIFEELAAQGAVLQIPADSHQHFQLKWSAVPHGLNVTRQEVSQETLRGESALYEWVYYNGEQTQPAVTRIYRVLATGVELEEELLPGGEFTDVSWNNLHRRVHKEGRLAHWDPLLEAQLVNNPDYQRDAALTPYAELQSEVMERYVLIIEP
ncbi:MAG: hypothetical protein ACOX18_05995 [Bacillota bacterium]|jgi:hypothetical protein